VPSPPPLPPRSESVPPQGVGDYLDALNVSVKTPWLYYMVAYSLALESKGGDASRVGVGGLLRSSETATRKRAGCFSLSSSPCLNLSDFAGSAQPTSSRFTEIDG